MKAGIAVMAAVCAAAAACGQQMELVSRIEVAPVWAGCPVGFAVLTHTNRQFLAFYSEERVMTLAQRALDSSEWTFAGLPLTSPSLVKGWLPTGRRGS